MSAIQPTKTLISSTQSCLRCSWWFLFFGLLVSLLMVLSHSENLPIATRGVCAIGNTTMFDLPNVEEEVRSFIQAWDTAVYDEIYNKKMNAGAGGIGVKPANLGGNQMYHGFGIWVIVKVLAQKLKLVDTYIESGVFAALTARTTRRLLGPEFPMVLLDPRILKNGWEPSGKVHDLRGKAFKDFVNVDWKAIGVNPSRSVVLFDDHMDQIRRVEEAHRAGFRHLIFDDNFIPGGGDIFSLKNACDGPRSAVRDYTTSGGGTRKRSPHRCDMFHRSCVPLTDALANKVNHTLHNLVDIYWEFPPLGTLTNPYKMYRRVRFGHFESWPPPEKDLKSWWTGMILSLCKPALLSTQQLKSIGFSIDRIAHEASQYFNLVYVRLRD